MLSILSRQKCLINIGTKGSVTTSAEGRKRVTEVAQAIQLVTSGTSELKSVIDQVHHASSEQSRGIQQIDQALTRMDQVTQGTVASSTQSAAASQQFKTQSSTLKAVVEELSSVL